MDGNRIFYVLSLVFVCLLLFALCEGRRRRRPNGGWNCDEDYDDDDANICYECTERNVTFLRWRLGRCGSDSANSGGNLCWKKVNITIPFSTCRAVCCKGWTFDQYGKCTISTTENTIVCENGGNSTTDGTCLCPKGFSGTTCNLAHCNPECQNSGQCQGHYGAPVCVCPDGFTGAQCETPICKEPCQNGGECKAQGYGSSACVCPEDFEGETCQHSIKPGNCPVADNYYTCAYNSYKYTICTYDQDCEDTEKCCFSGCGHHCLKPEIPKCEYSGKLYEINTTFTLGKCTTCTCLHAGTNGVECTKFKCPPISCATYKTTDSCCPVCEETGIAQGHGPVISTCPKSVEAHVHLDSNKADLTLNPKLKLEAKDHMESFYPVQLSKQFITHCACNDTRRNMHHVVATSSPDQYGRFANCTIPVKVVDPFPPKLRCPTSIRAFEDDVIAWDNPTARDNVGISSLELITNHKNNSYFVVGEYIVVYSAKDFDGNEAVCTFVIQIYTADAERQMFPNSTPKPSNCFSGFSVTAAIISAVLLTVLALITGICCCLRKRRKANERRGERYTPEAFDNNAYAISKTLPNDDNVAKPPEYVADPPVYEVIDPMKKLAIGIDNPIYEAADEKKEIAPDEIDVSLQENKDNDQKCEI